MRNLPYPMHPRACQATWLSAPLQIGRKPWPRQSLASWSLCSQSRQQWEASRRVCRLRHHPQAGIPTLWWPCSEVIQCPWRSSKRKSRHWCHSMQATQPLGHKYLKGYDMIHHDTTSHYIPILQYITTYCNILQHLAFMIYWNWLIQVEVRWCKLQT